MRLYLKMKLRFWLLIQTLLGSCRRQRQEFGLAANFHAACLKAISTSFASSFYCCCHVYSCTNTAPTAAATTTSTTMIATTTSTATTTSPPTWKPLLRNWFFGISSADRGLQLWPTSAASCPCLEVELPQVRQFQDTDKRVSCSPNS